MGEIQIVGDYRNSATRMACPSTSRRCLAIIGLLLAPAAGFDALPARAAVPLRRTSAPVATLPSLAALTAASVAPTCLGFWKNGYAVSYAYGGAMAAGALLTLPHTSGLAAAHALAYIFYGVRLNLFLLYRELALPESVHQMVNRPAGLKERLKRAPIILGCSGLYFCMLASLRVTATIGTTMSGPSGMAVGLMYAGLGIAALGDTVKSVVKAKEGKDTLVTAFPHNLLRHPNYTGEFFGWTASFAAAILAAASSGTLLSSAVWLIAAAVGTAGIQFVLAGAAGGLEKKQKEKHGGSAEYDEWIRQSWPGPVLAKSAE